MWWNLKIKLNNKERDTYMFKRWSRCILGLKSQNKLARILITHCRPTPKPHLPPSPPFGCVSSCSWGSTSPCIYMKLCKTQRAATTFGVKGKATFNSLNIRQWFFRIPNAFSTLTLPLDRCLSKIIFSLKCTPAFTQNGLTKKNVGLYAASLTIYGRMVSFYKYRMGALRASPLFSCL